MKKHGNTEQSAISGTALLSQGLKPNFWRVPTDNDEGGGDKSYAARWRKAGLDKAKLQPVTMQVNQVNPQTVKVTVTNHVKADSGSIAQKTVYTIMGGGDILVDNAFTPKGQLPPLAKVGFQLQMPGRIQ